MNADGQLRSFVDRVLRLKEEQDTLSADIREVYAEAKGMGFDKTALGEIVAYLRKVEKKGEDAIAEQSSIFDLYLDAYKRATGTAVATHTHASASSVQHHEDAVLSAYAGTASEENPAPILNPANSSRPATRQRLSIAPAAASYSEA